MPQSPLANLLRQFAVKAEEQVNDLAKGVAIAITDAVAEATPVDTGRARSNWQVSVGAPVDGDIDPYAPGERLGREESENLAEVMEAARSALSSYQGGDIFIVNNATDPESGHKYIWELHDGSSNQFAGDFFGVADSAAYAYWRTGKK